MPEGGASDGAAVVDELREARSEILSCSQPHAKDFQRTWAYPDASFDVKGNEACNPLQSVTFAKQTSSEVDVKKETADPCAMRRFNYPVSKPKSIFMKPYAHSS